MSGVFINLFHYELNKSEITVYTQKFSDKQTFKKLREENKNIGFYSQNGIIYYWPKSNKEFDKLNSEDEQILISVNDFPNVTSKIIETSIVDFLGSNPQIKVMYEKYGGAWILRNEKNLFENKIPGLGLFRGIRFSTFYGSLNGTIKLCLTFSVNLGYHFLWNKNEFTKNHIDITDLKSGTDFVYASPKALKRFLEATGKKEIFAKELNSLATMTSLFNTINGTFNFLKVNKDNLNLPDLLKISNLYNYNIPNNNITYEKLNPPQYYFYSEQTSNGYYHERIKKLKPYSYENFNNTPVNIEVICPKIYEGTIENFVSKIKNELISRFHIGNLNISLQFVAGENLKDYKEKIYNLEFSKINLVIVIVKEEHKKLKIEDSPYYYCKAKLIGQSIPTQEVLIEKVKISDTLFINSIALNIYAKLGGTPWTIEKQDKLRKELIVGVGSTINSDGQNVLGIAQIFDYNGRYLIGDCIPISDLDTYSKTLEDYLTSKLDEIITKESKIGNDLRIIFHLNKSASNKYEIKAIENIIAKYNDTNFQYALVHISYAHNYRIYNNVGRDRNIKGLFCQLDDLISLVHFVPQSDTPLLLRVDKRSNFKDLYYISKQIFWFSHLSYRSYIPSKKAVTILYPSLMAKLTEELKEVPSWDIEVLKNLGDKLWFI